MSELSREPVSWLLLERYALGELASEERADVERRLAASLEDRACLEAILHDDTVLPPLPTPIKRRPQRAALATALTMAAAFMLTVWRPFADTPSRREVQDGVKGGEVAVQLISERTGTHPTRFEDRERFKLLVTCPDWLLGRLSVVVFQDGQRYQPLTQSGPSRCGNAVPWPGAFSLDGAADVEVCVTWSERAAAARAPAELGSDVVCERLRHR